LLNELTSTGDVKGVLDRYHSNPDRAATTIGPIQAEIERCFGGAASLQEIMDRCRQSEWGREQIRIMDEFSPLTMLVAFKSINMGRNMTISEVLSMEFDLVTCFVGKQIDNFNIGVTHRLINRKRDRPNWVPESISAVSEELINFMFQNPSGPWLFT
jgi:hypothetical protein